MKITLNSIQHNVKSVGRQKTSFTKEMMENADLCTPILDKIMIT